MQTTMQRKWPVELTLDFIKAKAAVPEVPEDKDENGMYRIYEGARVGRLTLIGETYDVQGRRGRWWLVRCRCGTEKTVSERHLKIGNTRSCGCLLKETVKVAIGARRAIAQAKKTKRMEVE